MKFKFPLVAMSVLVLAGCASQPTASNYNNYMNAPQVKQGASGDINDQIANKAGWNKVEVTQMTSVRRLENGDYSADPAGGFLTVRAVLVNSGNTPVQGNWRCLFFDSNNMPLYENASNQQAGNNNQHGLGWHRMVVYPLSSKSQTNDANVVNCKAPTSLATNYRVEFHDTGNDITVYNQ